MTSVATAPATAARPGRSRRKGGLLWHRDFRRLWIGQTSSSLGSSVTSVALPLVAVATLAASTFQVALLAAAAWLPWLLIGLPAGAWVDRLPRRSVMVACDLASLLLFLSVPVAAWLEALTVGHLLAVALGAGVASVFFQTAYQVYLPFLLSRDEVSEGNAKLQGTEAGVQVVGPGLAGLIAQRLGAVHALLLDAASFLVSAICLLAIRKREPRPAGGRRSTSLRRDIGEGLRFVVRDPYLRVFATVGAVSNLGLTGYQALLVVFLVRDVGMSPGAVGALVAAMSLGGVAGAAIASWIARRFGTARAVLLCQLGTGPFGLLIPLTDSGARLAFVVVGGLVLNTGIVAGNVVRASFRQTYTPHHLLGRVVTSFQLVNYGAIPLGALLAGSLGTAFDVRSTMWIMMGTMALAGLVLLIGPIRRHRDLPSQPSGIILTGERYP